MNVNIVNKLLKSGEPSVRYKTLVNVLDESPQSSKIKKLQSEIKKSSRVQTLLSMKDSSGTMPFHPYTKWIGAHWVMAVLSDIGYPSGDKSLVPLREQVYNWLLGSRHQKNIRLINGLTRRCVSQEGYAVYYSLKLGLADERTEELVNRIISWQWPDGGWNCDKNPEAKNSSFMESIVPMRALTLHSQVTKNRKSKEAVKKASDIFLKRKLFKKQRDGSIIREKFVTLRYPTYFDYDILIGLKAMGEAGFIKDPRCNEALDLLQSRMLPDGGFPSEAKLYQPFKAINISRGSLVDWGGINRRRYNEWVTVDALYVLRRAGRMS